MMFLRLNADDSAPVYRAFGVLVRPWPCSFEERFFRGGTSLFSVDAVSSFHVVDMTQDLSDGEFNFQAAGVQIRWTKRE